MTNNKYYDDDIHELLCYTGPKDSYWVGPVLYSEFILTMENARIAAQAMIEDGQDLEVLTALDVKWDDYGNLIEVPEDLCREYTAVYSKDGFFLTMLADEADL